jgi:hypothetical protein
MSPRLSGYRATGAPADCLSLQKRIKWTAPTQCSDFFVFIAFAINEEIIFCRFAPNHLPSSGGVRFHRTVKRRMDQTQNLGGQSNLLFKSQDLDQLANKYKKKPSTTQ